MVDERDAPRSTLRVAVLSCGDLGIDVANRLLEVDGVEGVSLVTAPYVRRRLGLRARLRQARRAHGWLGLAGVAARKLASPLRPRPRASGPATAPVLRPEVHHRHFADFHSPDCIEALRALRPDLGVIAGTYILKPDVFEIPRLGSINLHSGKVPEYRGAAPAFWELYNGETAVGITIHRVVRAVDAGSVLRQELFPLDPAPPGDPLEYVERFRRDVLRPNGVRMLVETVAAIAGGTAEERPQDHARAATYKSPDHRAIRELRRRVRERRRAGGRP
ncbi:MAG TPA: formyltransferase family protein [Gemmatimonadaceae bacterium]|nr:formyltransferase family protein [Gemmatimonadaceae bacterium]